MRYLCKVAYDGSHFYGFQRQPKHRTVQGDIEQALKRIYGEHIDIHSSSRTDTGVHALAQVFHYDTDIEIPETKLRHVLDGQLPEEISILSVEKVADDFHARYNTIQKTYRYDIILSKEKQMFKSRYALIYKRDLNIELLKEASKLFLGRQDYKALMASGSDKENTVRDIKAFDLVKESEDKISLYITADGFLYHMVRIIVGALLDYSEGRRTLSELEAGLKNKDRSVFRRTAPANGLYLVDIVLSF